MIPVTETPLNAARWTYGDDGVLLRPGTVRVVSPGPGPRWFITARRPSSQR